MAEFVSTYGLFAAYILVGIALVAAIVLPIIQSFSDPKSLLGSVVGLVIIGVIFFIGFSIASDEVTNVYMNNKVTEGTTSQIIGGAIITMYIMVILAIVGIVITEVTKVFK
ncbi:hypothetical protein [Tunicatimonas pelagia]|uniref:hypothetical protein n=1 Tax=Tunicatimonas pelagia TaxID=931531 RepID=UPI00266662C5|nr:hypothetical protein [Tunicatimonas pelagia]WKN41349.1 hypothetical protein P0M28_20135 [Tunicatimonas pelagia]